MTGQPGHRTMEMIGGSSASYLARTPCVPLFCTFLVGVETEGLLDYQGRAGDHFHCTVKPLPGRIRCRALLTLDGRNSMKIITENSGVHSCNIRST